MIVSRVTNKVTYQNEHFNKKGVGNFLAIAFHNYSTAKSALVVDRFKSLLFRHATIASFSFNLEDIKFSIRYRTKRRKIPRLIKYLAIQGPKNDDFTFIERFCQVRKAWDLLDKPTRDGVFVYFEKVDPCNPFYVASFSGARGTTSQVRQILLKRGLIQNLEGVVINIPVQHGLYVGLSILNYVVCSYGARKGLVDSALRTADAGYLTRRLYDLVQDIVVREQDCLTQEGISFSSLGLEKILTEPSFKEYKKLLLGRLLAKSISVKSSLGKSVIIPKNTELNENLINQIPESQLSSVIVRSSLTCESKRSVCRNCYGWRVGSLKKVPLGDVVGVIAAQSVGEPGTQLTLRSFHGGGVYEGFSNQTYSESINKTTITSNQGTGFYMRPNYTIKTIINKAKQIHTPFSGILKFDLDPNILTLVKIQNNKKGFYLKTDLEVHLATTGFSYSFRIPNGFTLLIFPKQVVFESFIIAESYKNVQSDLSSYLKGTLPNLIGFEIARKPFFGPNSYQVVLQGGKYQKGHNSSTLLIRKSSILCFLSGNFYTIPNWVKLNIKIGQRFYLNKTIASQNIVNNYSGFVNFGNSFKNREMIVAKGTLILQNGFITIPKVRRPFISITWKENDHFNKSRSKLFALINPCKGIGDGKIIASCSESYKTRTGGILYYSLDYNVTNKFTGIVYWIEEETYRLRYLTAQGRTKLLKKNGDFIPAGTRLTPKLGLTKISGFLEIRAGVTVLIKIKPGMLAEFENIRVDFTFLKKKINTFIKLSKFKPLEIQSLGINQIKASSFYIEFASELKDSFLLRPVVIFNILAYESVLDQVSSENNFTLKVLTRLYFKHFTRVERSIGICFSEEVLFLKMKKKRLKVKLEYINFLSTKYQLKLNLYETLENLAPLEKEKLEEKIMQKVISNSFVTAKTLIARRSLIIKNNGRLIAINRQNSNNREIILLLDRDVKKYWINSNFEIIYVKIGDLVQVGNFLSSRTVSSVSGQVCKIYYNYILIRLGSIRSIYKGSLLSLKVLYEHLLQTNKLIGTDLGIFSNSLIKIKENQKIEKIETILRLRNETTDNIASGVKYVETLLEARLFEGCLLAPCEGKASITYEFEKPNSKELKRFLFVKHPSSKLMTIKLDEELTVNFKNDEEVKLGQSLSDGSFNTHDLLETLYKYYGFIFGDTSQKACKKSFTQVHLYLLQEVRNMYTGQSVDLSNKHLEILVKQLTLKVCITESGDTILLPGEVLNTADIAAIEKSVKSSNQQPPSYKPILLGLTKASLNSDSFIAAASFQETTRILMEAAIQGRKDWLFGLKENVIVGRLLPIGTGCTPVSFLTSTNKNIEYRFSLANIRDYILESRKS